jgi:hypothetical protein
VLPGTGEALGLFPTLQKKKKVKRVTFRDLSQRNKNMPLHKKFHENVNRSITHHSKKAENTQIPINQ